MYTIGRHRKLVSWWFHLRKWGKHEKVFIEWNHDKAIGKTFKGCCATSCSKSNFSAQIFMDSKPKNTPRKIISAPLHNTFHANVYTKRTSASRLLCFFKCQREYISIIRLVAEKKSLRTSCIVHGVETLSYGWKNCGGEIVIIFHFYITHSLLFEAVSCKHIMERKVWRRNDRCVCCQVDGICITRGWWSSLKSPPLIRWNEINIKEAEETFA